MTPTYRDLAIAALATLSLALWLTRPAPQAPPQLTEAELTSVLHTHQLALTACQRKLDQPTCHATVAESRAAVGALLGR